MGKRRLLISDLLCCYFHAYYGVGRNRPFFRLNCPEQITAIEITIIDGFSCSCPDREWIEQFVSVISSAQTTDKPAVQEDPDSDYDGEFSILDGDRITGTIYYYLKDNRGYMKLIWKD